MLDRESGSPETEEAIGKQIVGFYRAWDHFEEIEMEDEVDGIDFDLIEADFEMPRFSSRVEIADMFENLAAGINPSTQVLEFFKAKLTSTATFIRALEGQRLPLAEYVQKTLGIFPELERQEGIEMQREKTDRAFYDLGFRPSPEEYKRFFAENLLDRDEIVQDFNNAKNRITPIVVSRLGLEDLLPLEYQESFVEKDEYWICWIKGTPKGMEFRINLHQRNRLRWFKGSPELLAVHEMDGHLLQALNWRRSLREGRLNPGYGATSIPGPEQWACEGMADAIPALMPEVYDNLSSFGRFAFEVTHLSDLVMNNVHIMVNNGYSLEDVKEYVHSYLPHETDQRIEKSVLDRSANPTFRSYLLTYSDGGRFFVRAAQTLGEKSAELLKELYSRPMTPKQIKAFVAELRNH